MKKTQFTQRMRRLSVVARVACVLFLVAQAMASHSVKEDLKIGDLPPTAQKAVTDELNKGATLRVIHAITEQKNGETWFLARFVVNGHPREINFDPKGNVTSVEDEVSLESLPAVVLNAVHKSIPSDAKVRNVEADREADGETSYVVRTSVPPKALTFDEKGNITESVSKAKLESLPKPVQTGISAAVGKGTLVHGDEVEEITKDGATSYAVDVRNEGVRSKLFVDVNGRYVK